MYANKNNLRSELTANIGVLDTTIAITAGEGVLWEADTVACLEHYENDICIKREIVKITTINNDTLTVTRGFATCIMNDNTKERGNTSQTFGTGDFLSVYLSKELWESLTIGITVNQTNYATMVARINAPRTCINDCCQSWKDAIDCAYYEQYCGNAGFGTGADGDCVITEDAFLCADCEYNFNNLTICPNVLVRFEGNGVPTINVWKDFKNCGTIDLRAGYIPNCCQTDCWLEQGCTICNLNSDLGLNCGGAGGIGATYSSGRVGCTGETGCPGSGTTGGYGGAGGNGYTGGIGCPGGAPDGCNGGNGGRGGSNPSSYAGGGGGGGGGGAGRFGNGGNGGNGGTGDDGAHAHGVGGNGGNSGLFGTGGTGGEGGSTGNNGAGNGGNGYYGGTGGEGGECGRAGDGGCGVVKGGAGGDAYGIRTAGNGGNAITNVYGFHLNARNIYNNCVNARGGDGGKGGKAECGTSGSGGNGANGGQMIVLYENMCEEGCFDVSAGCGGEPGHLTRPQCGTCGSAGSAGNAGWLVLKSSRSPYIQNFDLQNDSDNEAILISWKDPRVLSWNKTVIRYSTTDYPANLTDGTLAVEETTRNQYQSTPYSLTGVLDETTYYFTAFALDGNNSVIDTETATITTDFGRHVSANTVAYRKLDGDLTDEIGNYNLTAYNNNYTWGTLADGITKCLTKTVKTNSFISTLSDTTAFGGNFTLSFFVNPSQVGSIFRILGPAGDIDYTNVQFESGSGGLQRYNDTETGRTSWSWTPTANTRYHIVITGDGTGYTAYLNGNLMTKIKSGTIGTAGRGILIGNNFNQHDGNGLIGSLSNVIIEKVIWSQQEITSYLNKMKSLYGIS